MSHHSVYEHEESTGYEYPSVYTDKPGIFFLQTNLLATLLEDAITQIRLLSDCNYSLRILRMNCDRSIHLRTKYGVFQPIVTDELANINIYDLKCDKYKLDKLAADRDKIYKVFESTYLDLALRKCYENLCDFNKSLLAKENYAKALVEDEMNNKIQLREVIKQLRQQRTRIRTVTYDTDQIIENLKGSVEDASLYSEARSRYMENWQAARAEQNTQTIFDTEAGSSKNIEYYRQRQDHEARVHTEVEALTNIIINETLRRVEDWMNKYDRDMEAIDLKIQLKKNDYNSMTQRRLDMEELYAEHEKEMKDWVKYTTEREQARVYHLKMTTAAIAVQAWWRGLLVRLELGPYKVAKKKGAGPPGAKKK